VALSLTAANSDFYARQADELDLGKRPALLDRVRQRIREMAISSPIQPGFLNGVASGRRPWFATISGFAYTAPFKDPTIKA
jgi:hypothetical protein